MSIQAFGPRGNTANIACNQTSSVPVQVVSTPNNCYTYQFVNTGSNKAYFAYSQRNDVTASIPAAGTPANGVCILPNEVVIYNLTPNAWIAAICPAGQTTSLEVTPGEGM